MQTTSKKLLKEIRSILSASEKAKKIALAELEKIDEKYKALAESEKSELKRTVAMLDAQISAYGPMLQEESEEKTDAETAPDSPESESEEKVVDTLFEDNNAEESSESEEDTESESEEKDEVRVSGFSVETENPEGEATESDTESPWEEAESTESAEAFESSEETGNAESEEGELNTDDGWPELPEEWK